MAFNAANSVPPAKRAVTGFEIKRGDLFTCGWAISELRQKDTDMHVRQAANLNWQVQGISCVGPCFCRTNNGHAVDLLPTITRHDQHDAIKDLSHGAVRRVFYMARTRRRRPETLSRFLEPDKGLGLLRELRQDSFHSTTRC